MNGRLKYNVSMYLEALGSEIRDSKQISEALNKLGFKATPRQVTHFIKQNLNHFIDIRRVNSETGSSYHNVYQLAPGAVNVS